MQRRTYRLGWMISVLAVTAMACTCGALGQAQNAVETAQALATAGNELATAAQGFATEGSEFATQIATTGALETLEAVSTSTGGFGEGPDDIPVFSGGANVIATTDAVAYTSSGTAVEVSDFYKAEMVANGWTESADPISASGTFVLTYTKDNREAVISISEFGGQVSVAIGITAN
jgi:hypothetical protein